ncbi:MAG: pyruvate kinase alpha/beta domain-containing protein [Moorellales bacterium]
MYWEKPGPENTERTVELAVRRAKELHIQHLVVASNTGQTARLCLGRGPEVIVVTHHVGFTGPGQDEMPAGERAALAAAGAKLLTATHLMAGLDRAVRMKFGGLYPAEIIAASLRLLGQGVKVGVEIACMALDAGLIPYGREVVTVAGTGRGADTALVVLPSHSNTFFDTQVREVICKPRQF